MSRFWISWRDGSADYRPVTFPPRMPVLGWWVSGEGDGHVTLCAVVEARHEADARGAILKDWPEALELGDWRFFERKPSDWQPGERFPLSDWMSKRFAASST